MKYPECEKLQKVSKESQICGSFLEFLYNKGYVNRTAKARYKTLEQMLAEYFEIDLNKVENEREQILNSLRKE